MWTRGQVVDHYCERMGFEMIPERWRFYKVFGLLRLVVIAQQIWHCCVHRQTTNEQVFERATAAGPRLSPTVTPNVAAAGETMVVVSSGGPIAAIAAVAAGLLQPDANASDLAGPWSRFNTVTVNSSVTRVLVGSSGARLLTFNEHSHLAPDLLTYR